MPQEYAGKTPTKQLAQNALVTCPERSRRMAVVRGHIWRGLLESGTVKSIACIERSRNAEIARANKVDGSYVSRMLDLTLLAPDIIDAIFDGKEPSGLSLTMLTKKKIPPLWEEQHRELEYEKWA